MKFLDPSTPVGNVLHCMFATFVGTIIIVFIQKVWKLRKDRRALQLAQKEKEMKEKHENETNDDKLEEEKIEGENEQKVDEQTDRTGC